MADRATTLQVRSDGPGAEAWIRAAVDVASDGAWPSMVHVRVVDGALEARLEGRADALQRLERVDVIARSGEDWDVGVVPLARRFSTQEMEHTADEGFVVEAPTRADLLAAAAEALGALVVNPDSVRPLEVRRLQVTTSDGEFSLDERMFTWLAEVLYEVDAHRFAIRRVALLRDDDGVVEGVLIGEPLDEARHDVKGAVKAMTYHALQVEQRPGGSWRAQVVVDV